jgi:amino acid permease
MEPPTLAREGESEGEVGPPTPPSTYSNSPAVTPTVTPVAAVLHKEPPYPLGIRPKRLQYRRLLNDLFSHVLVYHPEWFPRGSELAVIFNMTASTVGVGTLAMPIAAKGLGIYLFAPLMLILVLCSLFSMYILCRCADLTHFYAFELLSRHIFGSRVAQRLVEMMLIVDCFGSMILYIVVVGDVGLSTLSYLWGSSLTSFGPVSVRFSISFMCYFAVMLPISMLGSVGALKYASIVGCVALAFVTVGVVWFGLREGSTENLAPIIGDVEGILTSVPLLFFAFANQINGLEIYSELPPQSRTPKRFVQLSLVAVVVSAAIYLSVGYAGLATYGQDVRGNILTNYPQTAGLLIVAATLGMGVKTVLGYPLQMFPTREALFHAAGVERLDQISIKLWVAVTFTIGSASFLVASVLPSILVLFDLLGALCASLFAFILPAAFGLTFNKYWDDTNTVPPAVNPGAPAAHHGVPAASGRNQQATHPLSLARRLERVSMLVLLLSGVAVALGGSYVAVVALVSN